MIRAKLFGRKRFQFVNRFSTKGNSKGDEIPIGVLMVPTFSLLMFWPFMISLSVTVVDDQSFQEYLDANHPSVSVYCKHFGPFFNWIPPEIRTSMKKPFTSALKLARWRQSKNSDE